MCTLKTHINNSIFRKNLLKIEKIVKIFSILDKLFLKLFYCCVPLGHILVKSIKKETILYMEMML